MTAWNHAPYIKCPADPDCRILAVGMPALPSLTPIVMVFYRR